MQHSLLMLAVGTKSQKRGEGKHKMPAILKLNLITNNKQKYQPCCFVIKWCKENQGKIKGIKYHD